MKLFISYRRDDSAGHAGRLFDHLAAQFGAGNVFMDMDTIQPGEDFRKAISTAVGSCEVVLVLIGRQWLTITDGQGQRRLDDARDWVRTEISSALANPNTHVIPVLVQEADMPSEQSLPADLKELSWRNAFEIRDSRFQQDAAKLVDAIKATSVRSTGSLPSRWKTNRTLMLLASLLVPAILALVFMIVRGAQSGAATQPPASGQAALVTATLPSFTSTPTDVPTATPPQTLVVSEVPANPVPSFFDNFDDGIDAAVWQVNLNDWNVDRSGISAAQIYNGATMFLGDAGWQNYQVTVNTSASKPERTSYVAAIYVRYQDADNFVQFVFDCDFPSSTILWQYKRHGNLTRVNATQKELGTCKLEPYVIQLSVRDTKYEARVDGQVTTFSLDLFESGGIGLFSGENGGEAAGAFDNFVLEP